jgi:hypothetical protein
VLHELVTVATAGGPTKVIDITIQGANDAAVITGTAARSVKEKSGVNNGTAGGGDGERRPRCDDVDSAATFVAQSNDGQDLRHVHDRTRPARGATRSTTATGMSRRSMPATRCTSW